MATLAMFGVWNVLLPLLFWVPLFALGAGLIGLSTLRRARRQLVTAGHPTRLATALIGILLLVALPVGAGFLGGTFALKRGLASVIEKGGEQVVGWSVTRGAASMQAALNISDPHKKMPTAELRAMIATQLAGTESMGTLPAARIGSPIVLLFVLPQMIERAFWSASNVALAHVGNEISWNELVIGARLTLHASSHVIFKHISGQLYTAAHADLLALAVALVFLHGLALLIVWWLCRKRLTVET